MLAKEVLHGNEQVAALLLVVLSLGVGAGALLCEIALARACRAGLVPLGAVGMTVFAVDLWWTLREPAAPLPGSCPGPG